MKRRVCFLLFLSLSLFTLGCGNAGEKGRNKGLDIPKAAEPKAEEPKK